MDGWRNQRSEPRAEPFIPALSEIGATCPRCSRADFRRDHRSQDAGHWAQIRACANVEKVRRDRQAAGDTPPGGVGADSAPGYLGVPLVVIIRGHLQPTGAKPDPTSLK